MAELSKLYVDVVGVTTPGALRAVLDIVPLSHLLFGSDYPFWAPDVTIKGLAGLKLSAADLQAIERDNALKLLPGCRGKHLPAAAGVPGIQAQLECSIGIAPARPGMSTTSSASAPIAAAPAMAACRTSPSPVVPWPRVSSLAGIR